MRTLTANIFQSIVLVLGLIVILAFNAALSPLTRAADTIKTTKDSENSVIALRNAGLLAYNQGRHEDAIESWRQALAILQQQPEPLLMDDGLPFQADLLRRLAIAAQILGFNQLASTSLHEALDLIRQIESELAEGAEQQDSVVNPTPVLAIQTSRILSQLGDLALGDGDWRQAGEYLGESVALAQALEHPATLAQVLNNLANALTLSGDYDKALSTYTESLQWAQSSGKTTLADRLLLNLIRLHLKPDQPDPGRQWQLAYNRFRQAANDQLKRPNPVLTSAGDLIALALLGQQLQQYHALADATVDVVHRQAPQVQREEGQLLPEGMRLLADNLSALREQLLQRALSIAETFRDSYYQAYAHGYLGQLDEARGDYRQALAQTEKALLFAEHARDPAGAYLWHWQTGRLYRVQGQMTAAIAAYRQAVATLNPIRDSLMSSHNSDPDIFRERIQPVYFGLADLLLLQSAQLPFKQQLFSEQQTATNDDRVSEQQPIGAFVKASYQPKLTEAKLTDTAIAHTQRSLLQEALDTVELLKAAELQDYFQDECTVALQAKETRLDDIDLYSAVIYPIILPQRLVLLISTRSGLEQVVVPVKASDIEETARRFRQHLQTRSKNSYLRESRQLYDWLIRPLHSHLQVADIDTLVFVPDGVLRTVPFSTLQDRENNQYLIERYALAMTPSLSLTDPQPFWREGGGYSENSEVLIVGLSEGVQNFSPLPSVPRELRTVQSLLGGDIIQDREYSADTLAAALRETEYSVLHLATHGVFGGSEEHSFLLTYDDKINMRELGGLLREGIFREQPLELLTLSACQTALGNDRAGLGLAGVAVQSGARSANASLWFVDDAATAELITEFYRQLAGGNISKARALQNAQLSLLKQAHYRHPIYWGAFLLIGNWL